MTLKWLSSGFSRSPLPHGRAGGQRGFTLMELMVTVSIIAFVTLLAAPAIRVDAVEADAAAHKVRSAMQHAQRIALVQQHQVLVSFDVAKQRIRIVEDKNSDSFLNSGERIMYRPLEVGNSFAPPPKRLNGAVAGTKWVFGTALMARNGMATVMFRRDGSLNTDLELYVRSIRRGETSQRALTVGMATGRVDWYKYLGGTNVSTMWRRGGI